MKVLNYDLVARLGARGKRAARPTPMRIHKANERAERPELSIVLLDWSCRERFHTLDWLNRQNVARDRYELIWVELYGRIVPEAMQLADAVVTLDQRGMYHKHAGYNAGLLNARGDLLTVCDSDAVFPQDFVASVFAAFAAGGAGEFRPLTLMHHELRTSLEYPDGLDDAESLKDQARWQWWPLHPNAGACMTVRKVDAIRHGGFDEHASYRGYLCGPYDLGWRLVNAGIPEVWHDESTVLWHFAHPDPVGVNGLGASVRQLFENTYPHVDLHAMTAVEAFSTGRVLPLQENDEIHGMRMRARVIGTPFEARYSDLTGPRGFSRTGKLRLRLGLLADQLGTAARRKLLAPAWRAVQAVLGARWSNRARRLLGRPPSSPPAAGGQAPQVLGAVAGYNLVSFRGHVHAVPHSLGKVNFFDERELSQPGMLRCASREDAERRIGELGRDKAA